MCFDAGEETTVFYDPVQVQNRNLSVVIIARYAARKRQQFIEKQEKRRLRREQQQQEEKKEPPLHRQQEQGKSFPSLFILDALAASGLISMRYWKECGGANNRNNIHLDQ